MGRTPRSSKDGLNKGSWTASEDKLLTDYVAMYGEGKWSNVSKRTGLKRCGKGCRLRWLNYLRPDIKRGNISDDEEQLIIRLHKLLGNRWSLIAGRLPGRTDNEIKNYWNSNLAKRAPDLQLPLPELDHQKKQPFQLMSIPSFQLPDAHQEIREDDEHQSLEAANESETSDDPSEFLMDFNVDDFCQMLESDFSSPNDDPSAAAAAVNGRSSEQVAFPVQFEGNWDADNNVNGSEFMSLVNFLDSDVEWPK
ncbi:hypothetical protein JCGZ_07008 [Jatropha curcas]|uniref:MYB family protein n=1 Tax=Jatropha curcas TaxID=180498 RepID=A0A067KBC2_JATCU|nr:transcription factor MYB82 [Jatropha curcas]AIT52269.1 MYB family protein [Jatropha curcas]KDP33437.1 hypothetical protein JCGZ_07008 [Jatropha curcas]